MENWKRLVDSEIIGTRYNRLVLLETFIVKWVRYGTFLCDCGNITTKYFHHVKSGRTTSCGCYSKEMQGKKVTTHGMTKTSEFNAWQAMIKRCYNPNDTQFHNYGGRGIKVCDRWLNSFQSFFEDMGFKPTKTHSIDRFPNNNGDYEKSNCRWATPKQQAGNIRRNHWLEYNGERKILQDWAIELKTDRRNIGGMMKRKPFNEVVIYYKNKNNLLCHTDLI